MHKYHAKPCSINGHRFASQHEGRTYVKLLSAQQGKAICELRLQVPFRLEINGILVAKYIADFTYRDTATGEYVVVDAKGVRTAVYKLKKKMMKALLNIDILEV